VPHLEEPSSDANTGASVRSGMKHNTGSDEGQQHFLDVLLDACFMRFNPHPVTHLKRMIDQIEKAILIHPQLRATSQCSRNVVHTRCAMFGCESSSR
jgi:hypothetical protein